MKPTVLHTERHDNLNQNPTETYLKSQKKKPPVWDTWLLMNTFLLIVFGFVVMSSASLYIANNQYHDLHYFMVRQISFIVVGLLVLLMIQAIPMKIWERFTYLLFWLTVIALIVLLLTQKEVNGAIRWFDLRKFGISMQIQVSEFAKIALIFFAARFLANHQAKLRENPLFIWRMLFGLGIVIFLILRQPDYSTSALFCMILISMIFLSGYSIRVLFVVFSVIAILLSYVAIFSAYRSERLDALRDPWRYRTTSGYQIIEARSAIFDGGFWGKGIGEGIQKYGYLPEGHNDFLLAMLAEETGFIGVMGMAILFLLLVWRIFKIAHAADLLRMRFSALTAYGIGIWFSAQTLAHALVNFGVLPTTGLALPFFSYGGSSMLSCLIFIGIVMRISREVNYLQK